MFSRWNTGGEDYELWLYAKLLEHGFSSCVPMGQAAPFDVVSVSRFTGATHKLQLKAVSKPYKHQLYRARFTRGCKGKAAYSTSNVDAFVVLLVPLRAWIIVPNHLNQSKSLCVCGETSLHLHQGYERWELLHNHDLKEGIASS